MTPEQYDKAQDAYAARWRALCAKEGHMPAAPPSMSVGRNRHTEDRAERRRRVVAAYQRLGTITHVANELGLTRHQVREDLAKAGVRIGRKQSVKLPQEPWA